MVCLSTLLPSVVRHGCKPRQPADRETRSDCPGPSARDGALAALIKLGAIGELERRILHERHRRGQGAGKYRGRARRAKVETVRWLAAADITASEIGRRLNMRSAVGTGMSHAESGRFERPDHRDAAASACCIRVEPEGAPKRRKEWLQCDEAYFP